MGRVESCKGCRFSHSRVKGIIHCRRRAPLKSPLCDLGIEVSDQYWCGEFQHAEIQTTKPEGA